MDKSDFLMESGINSNKSLNTSSQEARTEASITTEEKIEDFQKEKQERQITQTDHINKKLLGSFLERLNQNDNSIAFGLKAQSKGEEDSDFVDQTDSLRLDS